MTEETIFPIGSEVTLNWDFDGDEAIARHYGFNCIPPIGIVGKVLSTDTGNNKLQVFVEFEAKYYIDPNENHSGLWSYKLKAYPPEPMSTPANAHFKVGDKIVMVEPGPKWEHRRGGKAIVIEVDKALIINGREQDNELVAIRWETRDKRDRRQIPEFYSHRFVLDTTPKPTKTTKPRQETNRLRVNRLIKTTILAMLQEEFSINGLAKAYNVSPRSIQRDLKAIRAAGLALTEVGNGVYQGTYKAISHPQATPNELTPTEQKALDTHNTAVMAKNFAWGKGYGIENYYIHNNGVPYMDDPTLWEEPIGHIDDDKPTYYARLEALVADHMLGIYEYTQPNH